MQERQGVPYRAEDWTIGPAHVWPPSRALLWCAGVDRSLLRTKAEALRYSGLGALVVAVAALGATTFTIFAAVVIGHFRWYLVPFGLAWGTVILLIDRAIVTEPRYRFNAARDALRGLDEPAPASEQPGAAREPGPPPGTVHAANGSANGDGSHAKAASPPPSADWRTGADLARLHLPKDNAGWHIRGLIYAMRLVITACIAYLVAEAAMLLIFHPEVTQALAQVHVAQFQQERTQAIDTAISQETGQPKILLQKWDAAKNDVATAQQVVNMDQAVMAAEEKGIVLYGPNGQTTSGTVGPGHSFDQDVQALQAAEKTLKTKQDDAENAEATYNALVTELQQAHQANPAALAALHVPDLKALQASTFADNGLNDQELAFDQFVANNRGDLLATAGPWVLRVLLISIDLVPLGTKLLNRYTLYGRRMSERALVIRYHDLTQDTAALQDLDQQAAISALHRQHDYDVETRRVGYRKSWQMNHLRIRE